MPFNRSRSSSDDGDFEGIHYLNGSPTGSKAIMHPSYYTEWMNGVDIENYHAKKDLGILLPLTDYEHFKEHSNVTLSELVGIQYGTHEYTWSPRYVYDVPGWRVDAAELAAAYAGAGIDPYPYVQAAASKAYTSGHDTLTFLAELHKTVRLFTDLQNKFVEKLSRENLTSEWLEARYGWRILMYDVEDIMKVLSNLDGERKRISERVGQKLTWTEDFSYMIDWGSSDHYFSGSTTYDLSVRGSIVADFTPPDLQFNPVLTAWELTRFSFVLDWFIGVGQWLEALSFLTFSGQHYAATGYRIQAQRDINLSTIAWAPTWSGYGSYRSTSKSVLTVRTPASVSLRPHVNVNLDSFKVLDLGAILDGIIRKKDFSKLLTRR